MPASLSKNAARLAADDAAEAPSLRPAETAAEVANSHPTLADSHAGGEESDPAPALDPEVQHQLGTLLRGMYADLLSRPMPDRFVDILQRLDTRPKDDRS